MRILLAPDKFKGSLSAPEAAEAMRRGILRAIPGAITVAKPIADGGEGTAEAISAALGGAWITLPSRDPLGRKIGARYAWLDEGAAVIDMSEASGLWRLTPGERNPLRTSTFGTGLLLRHALEQGARKIFVGLGGSATNDGGIGMAAALGFRFLDAAGKEITPTPMHLPTLARIEPPERPLSAEIVALCDVQNPLLGERGASRVFGPQKGADARAVAELDANLTRLADIVARDLGCDFRETPGAGAAGGLGFGMLSFCGAKIRSGFETVAEILRLEEEIAVSDFILTGEGRLDTQTLEGKGPAGVAMLARKHGKPVYAFAGSVEESAALKQIFRRVEAITPPGMPLKEALPRAAALLEESVAAVFKK